MIIKRLGWFLLVLSLLVAWGCALFAHQGVCDKYGAEAGIQAAAMCVSTIKENADEAQKRWSTRAETDVQKDVRKDP